MLHAGEKCSMTSDNDPMTGVQGSPDCGNVDGCTVKDHSANSYGVGFNSGGGGVYAMEWTEKSIRVWWWARNGIPQDVSEGRPNPHGWADPLASFSGSGCDIDKLFRDHQIVCLLWFRGAIANISMTCFADQERRSLISLSAATGLEIKKSGTRIVLPSMALLAGHM